jgi:predicted metal-dependent HD superfamily phosphohydrolase
MEPDRQHLAARWRDLCEAAGLTSAGNVDEAGRWLLDAYGVSSRAYHNLAHLAHCLAEFDAVRAHVADPVTAELAIWFHDSVYDPGRSDNELRSAEWARSVLSFLGATPGQIAAVQVIVMGTRHTDPPALADAPEAPAVADGALVADADLAILGQPQPAFDAYEQAIREEYRQVHDEGFRVARLSILKRLLARPRIYATLPFRARYETAARENLARSIERLSAPPAAESETAAR